MDAENWTIHSKDVIAQAQRCRVRLLATHGLIQGFIITREPPFERQLVASASAMPGELGRLRDLVSDNPEQSRLAERISSTSKELLAFMDEGRRLILDGRMDARTAASRRSTSQGMLEGVDGNFDLFLGEERRLDEARHARLQRSWAALDRLLLGGGVASVLCTVVVAVLFARNIGKRISGLTENARRLAESRELLPPMGGADEVAHLDRAFREMAATLAEAGRRERDHAEQIGRRAEELADVNGQLREKAQENELFVYSVSHDLRSPLVNLQGFSKELGLIGDDLSRIIDVEAVPTEVRRQGRRLIDVDMAESIGFIQTAVTRLAAIIDALLRLSRAGRVEYRQQEVDVSHVIGRVVSALRGTIEERRAVVAVGDLPAAWGDPTAIEQVFANLIGNAVNYLDPARAGRIEVQAVDGPDEDGANSGLAFYSIRDNGLGITDAHKSKVFTAFQRLHGDKAKGEGIGLTLVRRVVERHGGRIWFESEVGRGTTFFVALPSAEARLAASREPDPPMSTIGAGAEPARKEDAW